MGWVEGTSRIPCDRSLRTGPPMAQHDSARVDWHHFGYQWRGCKPKRHGIVTGVGSVVPSRGVPGRGDFRAWGLALCFLNPPPPAPHAPVSSSSTTSNRSKWPTVAQHSPTERGRPAGSAAQAAAAHWHSHSRACEAHCGPPGRAGSVSALGCLPQAGPRCQHSVPSAQLSPAQPGMVSWAWSHGHGYGA